jgi:hypothetical protein
MAKWAAHRETYTAIASTKTTVIALSKLALVSPPYSASLGTSAPVLSLCLDKDLGGQILKFSREGSVCGCVSVSVFRVDVVMSVYVYVYVYVYVFMYVYVYV